MSKLKKIKTPQTIKAIKKLRRCDARRDIDDIRKDLISHISHFLRFHESVNDRVKDRKWRTIKLKLFELEEACIHEGASNSYC